MNVSPDLSFEIFNFFVVETLKFECQCSQYIELNPTCVLLIGTKRTTDTVILN